MAELLASLDREGALSDVAFPRQTATLLVGAVALAVLRSLAEPAKEGAAASFVLPDALVDGFVADAENLITFESAANLLGAEVGPNELLNQLPLLVGEPAVASRARLAAVGLLLRASPAVVPIIRSAVASQLAADGAGVACQ